MSTPAELRAACFAILDAAKPDIDIAVKRILAAHALAIAQEAELQDRDEERAPSHHPAPIAP